MSYRRNKVSFLKQTSPPTSPFFHEAIKNHSPQKVVLGVLLIRRLIAVAILMELFVCTSYSTLPVGNSMLVKNGATSERPFPLLNGKGVNPMKYLKVK